MQRRPIFAANWKMNKTTSDTHEFCSQLSQYTIDHNLADIAIVPPFTAIAAARQNLPTPIQIGAQNVSPHLSGAYTGEISVPMLTELGCGLVIVGHSERRAIFHETDDEIAAKLDRVLASGLSAILCIGEQLSDRENGHTETVVLNQLNGALKPNLALLSDSWQRLTIAYEPVWAIGTGKVATVDQAQTAHHFVRNTLESLLGNSAANGIRIQYGGSVKPDNISALMVQPDIDGALVGGASLDAKSFYEIIKNGVTR